MGSRRRTEILAGLLLLIALSCGVVVATSIESRLVVLAQRAMANAGIPPVAVTFDGRDAVLRGRIDSRERARLAESAVGSVAGVREVRSSLIVGTSDRPPAGIGSVSELRAIRLGDQLFVSGRLPDAAARDALFAAATARFGREGVQGRIALERGASPPPWLGGVAAISEIAAILQQGGISLQARSARIWGRVPSSAAADRVRRLAARSFPDVAWTIDLAADRPSALQGT